MIRLAAVSKRYTLKQSRRGSLREAIFSTILNPGVTGEHWALRDISLEIPPGSSLALMGVNGCGKSTLLRLISGVTMPTSGAIQVEGRAGGVIEISSGFHTDLTGVENIYLQ